MKHSRKSMPTYVHIYCTVYSTIHDLISPCSVLGKRGAKGWKGEKEMGTDKGVGLSAKIHYKILSQHLRIKRGGVISRE